MYADSIFLVNKMLPKDAATFVVNAFLATVFPQLKKDTILQNASLGDK